MLCLSSLTAFLRGYLENVPKVGDILKCCKDNQTSMYTFLKLKLNLKTKTDIENDYVQKKYRETDNIVAQRYQ